MIKKYLDDIKAKTNDVDLESYSIHKENTLIDLETDVDIMKTSIRDEYNKMLPIIIDAAENNDKKAINYLIMMKPNLPDEYSDKLNLKHRYNKIAANQGDKESQLDLILYYVGKSTSDPKYYVNELKWSLIFHNFTEAKAFFEKYNDDDLGNKMTQDQIEEAEQLAKKWIKENFVTPIKDTENNIESDPKIWYLLIDKKPVGPINFKSIEKALKSNKITPDVLVCSSKIKNWTPLKNIKGISSLEIK